MYRTGTWGEQAKERAKQRQVRGEYTLAYQKARLEAIEKLGGKCVKCRISDIRVLQFDHKNNDGFKDRREYKARGTAFFHRIIRDNGKRFQLLCANCNWIKRFELKEVTDL